MEIRYQFTPADFEAMHRARMRAGRLYWAREVFYWLLVAANGAMGLWALVFNLSGHLQGGYWLSAVNLGIAAFLLWGRFQGGPLFRRWQLGRLLGSTRDVVLSLDGTGLDGKVGQTPTRARWRDIVRQDETDEHFFLWVNRMQAYVLPKRALSGPKQVDDLRRLIDIRMAKAKGAQ